MAIPRYLLCCTRRLSGVFLLLLSASFSLNAFAIDTDSDGVDNTIDNCLSVANASQQNSDGDDQGDACDAAPLAFNAPQQVVAGGQHSCVLTANDGVKCWGDNYYGQLGDGTMTNRTTPVNVSGLGSGVSAIAAGGSQASGSHTCALSSDGGVKCWGRNTYGQLGDGTTTDRTAPVNVSGLGSGVSAIATGGLHACALTSAGAVKCWGYNSSGQLGDATTTISRITPVFVTGYRGDTDGDGLGDTVDAFPYDTDNDGLDNAVDPDDDGDSVPDYIDAAPLNAANASEIVLPVNGSYKGSQVQEGLTVP